MDSSGHQWEQVAPPVNSMQPSLDAIRLEDARAMAVASWIARVKIVVFFQAILLVCFFVYGYALSSLVGVAMVICGVISVSNKSREPTFAYLILVPLNVLKDFVVILTYNPEGFLLGVQIIDMMLGLVAGYFAFFLYRNLTITRLNFGEDSNSANGQHRFMPGNYDPHSFSAEYSHDLDGSNNRPLYSPEYSPDTAGM